MFKNLQFERAVDYCITLLIGGVALAFFLIFFISKFTRFEFVNISLK